MTSPKSGLALPLLRSFSTLRHSAELMRWRPSANA